MPDERRLAGRPDLLLVASPDGPDELGRELAGGPDAVEATLAEVERLRPTLAPPLEATRRVVLVGTGASLAVGRTAVPLWRRRTTGAERAVEIAARQASEAALGDLDGQRFERADLVVAISQSGSSPETLLAARRARAAGSVVLALTAQADSPLASLASHVVGVASGPEHGASTKSALATLAGLLALADVLPSDAPRATAAAQRLREVAATWEGVVATGRLLASAGRTWCLGFGASLGIAEAAALLWHEKVVRPAVAATPSEFRHGLIEAARAGDAVVLIDVDAPDPRRDAYLAHLRAELAQLAVVFVEVSGAHVIGAPDAAGAIDMADPAIRALEALLRVQQLSRATALAAGTYRDGFAVLRRVATAADDLLA